MRSILTLPDVRARFTELGFDVVGGSPEDFAAFLKSENAKWKKIADIAKTKLD
jgi:tripartite-type tricarboxylate transporter receptor subunit TctC